MAETGMLVAADGACHVVYDLEFTTWKGALARGWSGPGEHREIVQIGAVRTDARFREVASLSLVVRPRRNPVLSDYFIELTGITQAQVDDEGVDIGIALQRLLAFADPGLPLVSNGPDGVVIAENCALAGLANPFTERTRDVHLNLLLASGRTHLISADLPKIFGLPPTGRGHDALADARAVAGALALMSARTEDQKRK